MRTVFPDTNDLMHFNLFITPDEGASFHVLLFPLVPLGTPHAIIPQAKLTCSNAPSPSFGSDHLIPLDRDLQGRHVWIYVYHFEQLPPPGS